MAYYSPIIFTRVKNLCDHVRTENPNMVYMAKPTDPRAAIVNAMLQRFGLSARWLSQRLEKNHVSVTSWLNGENSPRDPQIWHNMIEVLRDYEQSSRKTGNIKVRRAGIRSIPIYPGISAGTMNSTHSDVDYMDVMDWGSDRDRWGRVIDGYSMHPLLEPGDLVVFEDRPWEPNQVVHAFSGGEDTVKVIRKKGPTIELAPINDGFPVLPGQGVSIKGVAVVRIRTGAQGERTTTEYPFGIRHIPNSA